MRAPPSGSSKKIRVDGLNGLGVFPHSAVPASGKGAALAALLTDN
jgi:hypothetical protein